MASEFKRSGNTAVLSSEKIMRFEGLSGEDLKVLKRIDPDGDNLSQTVANLVQDMTSDRFGRMKLRPGCRKVELTGKNYSIGSIFQLNIGGLLHYGIVYNGGLDLISIPWRDFPPEEIDLEEDESKPSDWPPDWPWEPPVDDKPPSDPTDPAEPEEQVCELHRAIEAYPDVLVWSMPYADVSRIEWKSWYYRVVGYWPNNALSIVYGGPPAWLDVAFAPTWQFQKGPCEGETVSGIKYRPNGKDINGDWLEPGSYTFTATFTTNDGIEKTCDIYLTVAPPDITLTPESGSTTVTTDTTSDQTQVVAISNSGDVGSTLNWEVSGITGDAALTNILTVSPSSGALAKDASENVTLTMGSPGSLPAGTYTATITFRDINLTTVTDSYTLILTVNPPVPTSFFVYSGPNKTGSKMTATRVGVNTWQSTPVAPVVVYWTIMIDENTNTVLVENSDCRLGGFVSTVTVNQTGINSSGTPIAVLQATGINPTTGNPTIPAGDQLFLGEE